MSLFILFGIVDSITDIARHGVCHLVIDLPPIAGVEPRRSSGADSEMASFITINRFLPGAK
jgi:hypothetical protein